MITYYCLKKGYECFEDYINSWGIVDHKIYYTLEDELDQSLLEDPNNIHIFRYTLPSFIRTANSKVFVLNTEQLTESSRRDHIMGIAKLGIPIIDYSIANVGILKKANSKVFYIPYQYREDEIEKLRSYSSSTVKYDAGIVNASTSRRQKVLNDLKNSGLNVVDIRGWTDERDSVIGSCRVLLNVHFQSNFNVFEHIRCDRWIFAGKPIISENCDATGDLDITKYVTFTTDFINSIKASKEASFEVDGKIIEERKALLRAFIDSIV